jgi:DNA-directed RNA polymerase specialized sigma24 family protein
MDELNRYLQSLIQEICRYPLGSPQRRKSINMLWRVLLNSGHIQKREDELYEEALSKTMIKITENLCEQYDPSRGSFLPWVNTCLRHQHMDEIRAAKRHRDRIQSVRQTDEGERDPLDQVAAPIDANILHEIWESFVQWIKDDPEHLLQDCRIENNPRANCQSLAYLRLVEGKEWQEIVAEVGSSRGVISSHWSRKCKPLLEKWLGQNQRLFGEERDV